ncbi:hypothetical protein [Wenzhouxiangella marina]|uniref:Uncharacterized protein n=1 Tax=Wenzhouxiangella marina TaxID=1579979 RepID=A0A0K0XVB9_9GAMM|nr:hypothetical protein [Wenzhouxiangella marina]AKS41572.1 hypothetical protein WM2015_1198 [Wenzhouxiangella marina]MBB6086669.1 hypothetical protein [Wenzhouxiangella marina]
MSRLLRILLAGLLAVLLVDSALADDPVPRPTNPITARQCDKWEAQVEILSEAEDPVSRELGEMLQQPELRFCQTQNVRVRAPEAPDLDGGLDFDFEPIAIVLRLLMILLLIGLTLWLLMRWRPEVFGAWRRKRSERVLPASRSERIVDEDAPLPDDIVGAAEAAWRDGQPRLALSLLYRGALQRLWPDRPEIRGRTEMEVLGELRAAQAPDELLAFMRRLTAQWQSVAWAHRAPDGDDFEALGRDWRARFAAFRGGQS